jgi:hypothetical protein
VEILGTVYHNMCYFSVKNRVEILGTVYHNMCYFSVKNKVEILGTVYHNMCYFSVKNRVEILGTVYYNMCYFSVKNRVEILGTVYHNMCYFSVKNRVEIILKIQFFQVLFGRMIPEFSEGHFEKSGIIYPNTQSHNSAKTNPQQPLCTNFRSIRECNIFLNFSHIEYDKNRPI